MTTVRREIIGEKRMKKEGLKVRSTNSRLWSCFDCDSPRHSTTWHSIDPVHINHQSPIVLHFYLGNESPTEANVRLKIVEEDDAATAAEALL